MEAIRFGWVAFLHGLRWRGAGLFLWNGVAGDIGCLAWGFVEAHAASMGILNELLHRKADRSWAASLLPVLYLAGGLVLPIGATTTTGQWAMVIGAIAV